MAEAEQICRLISLTPPLPDVALPLSVSTVYCYTHSYVQWCSNTVIDLWYSPSLYLCHKSPSACLPLSGL